jgi:hypothetical protein
VRRLELGSDAAFGRGAHAVVVLVLGTVVVDGVCCEVVKVVGVQELEA